MGNPGTIVFLILVAAGLLRAIGLLAPLTVDLIYLAALVWLGTRLAAAVAPRAGLALTATIALGLILLAARLTWDDLRYAPYLFVLPANLLVAWIFGRSFLMGRQPILLDLIRIMDLHPVEDPRFVRFVRGQCLLWTGIGLTTALIALACLLWVVQAPWLAWVLTGVALGQLAWLPISHFYAAARYHRPETFRDTLKAISRPEARALMLP